MTISYQCSADKVIYFGRALHLDLLDKLNVANYKYFLNSLFANVYKSFKT